MLEKPLAKLEEMEKRMSNLLKSATAMTGVKARAQELEKKLKEVAENLTQEKSSRSESEKAAVVKLEELAGKARKLEEQVAKEKKLRADAADRVSLLIRDLEGEKPGDD
jgi:DNA repair ATPase RecN